MKLLGKSLLIVAVVLFVGLTVLNSTILLLHLDDKEETGHVEEERPEEPDTNMSASYGRYTAIYFYYQENFADHWEITIKTDKPIDVIVLGNKEVMLRYYNVTAITFSMPWIHEEQIIQFEKMTPGTANVRMWVDRNKPDERC